MLNYKSQSYIEVIVAVGIISMALLAIVGLGTAQIRLGGQSAKKLIASNLANEGIEICQAIRMDNWLDSTQSWPYGLEEGNWILDYTGSTLIAANNANILDCTNCCLCQQEDDSFKSCANSKIKRMISISSETSSTIQIISKVIYQEKGSWKIAKARVFLADWR